jgi:hypothetical protein
MFLLIPFALTLIEIASNDQSKRNHNCNSLYKNEQNLFITIKARYTFVMLVTVKCFVNVKNYIY